MSLEYRLYSFACKIFGFSGRILSDWFWSMSNRGKLPGDVFQGKLMEEPK